MRIPVPKKSPKIEIPKTLYNRKRVKKETRKLSDENAGASTSERQSP